MKQLLTIRANIVTLSNEKYNVSAIKQSSINPCGYFMGKCCVFMVLCSDKAANENKRFLTNFVYFAKISLEYSLIDFIDNESTLVYDADSLFWRIHFSRTCHCVNSCRSGKILRDPRLIITVSTCIPSPSVVIVIPHQYIQCWDTEMINCGSFYWYHNGKKLLGVFNCFTYIVMPHNIVILYFRLPNFHVTNSAIFST